MVGKRLITVCLTLAAIVVASAGVANADTLIEPGIDRAGSDYRSFDIGNADLRDTPELICRDACQKEGRCRARTYVKIGVQGPKARCWLKTAVPAARANGCCVTGVMTGVEPGIDRAGSDYRSFDIGNADLRDTPELICRDACRKESRCRAWTYVKIGVQGPTARCWLKTAVPAPRISNCCTSGSR